MHARDKRHSVSRKPIPTRVRTSEEGGEGTEEKREGGGDKEKGKFRDQDGQSYVSLPTLCLTSLPRTGSAHSIAAVCFFLLFFVVAVISRFAVSSGDVCSVPSLQTGGGGGLASLRLAAYVLRSTSVLIDDAAQYDAVCGCRQRNNT